MRRHRRRGTTSWETGRREQDQHRTDRVVGTEVRDVNSTIRRARRRAPRWTRGRTPSKMGKNGMAKVGLREPVGTRQWHDATGAATESGVQNHGVQDHGTHERNEHIFRSSQLAGRRPEALGPARVS